MLEISPKIVADVGLSVTDVTNYLIQHGWQQVTSQNDRLQVFQGINDELITTSSGKPFNRSTP
jgi:hypothetical protein